MTRALWADLASTLRLLPLRSASSASRPQVLLIILPSTPQWGEALRDSWRPEPLTHLLLATLLNIAGSFSHAQNAPHSQSPVQAHLPAARGEALSRKKRVVHTDGHAGVEAADCIQGDRRMTVT